MEDIAQTIKFGLYDTLLNAVNHPVLVVSSMGAQSTGKSYQLNHLGGTLFDVSGGRCTDGIWMSMRVVKDQVIWLLLQQLLLFLRKAALHKVVSFLGKH